MPVVNCWDMTSDALDSIVCSMPYTVILIDNGSEDQTKTSGPDLAGAFHNDGKNDNELIYLRNDPRRGVAASWNQGIKLAFEDPSCQKVAVLNNDILLNIKTLDHLIAFIEKTGYLMVTGDNVQSRMGVETMQRMELPEPFTDYDCWPIEGWRAEGPDFSCFMISRDTIRVIGWFDENFRGAYCEDQDYHARCGMARKHIAQHNDQDIDVSRVHFKRLSTAPYFHFSSQTISRNPQLRAEISEMHSRNISYYLQKYGGEHPDVMDGKGYATPFGDATKNWRGWNPV